MDLFTLKKLMGACLSENLSKIDIKGYTASLGSYLKGLRHWTGRSAVS